MRTKAEKLHKDAEALSRGTSRKFISFWAAPNLREVSILESGKDEGKTEKAVEKVSERQVKNQDRCVCLQIWHSLWVPSIVYIWPI